MSFSYPILLDVAGRRAVIVGGGTVAARKARALGEAGCSEVIAVAPAFTAAFPEDVQRITALYHPRHLEGAFLVFAATDSADANDAVVQDAEQRGILVTRADVSEQRPGTFANAAVHRAGALIVSVSTGGAPALAARVRDQIAHTLDPTLAAMAATMQDLRPRILANPRLDIGRRRAIFHDLASDEALNTLAGSGPEALRRWLETRHPVLNPDSGTQKAE